MTGWDDVGLLWLFSALGIGVALAVVVLAVGAVYGVFWLLREAMRAVVGMYPVKSLEEVFADEFVTVEVADARVSRRVRFAGAQGTVRVQAGLVPAASCVARRDQRGVDRRRQGGPPARHG